VGCYYLRTFRSATGAPVAAASSLWMRVDFAWSSVASATDYWLEVGLSTGAADYGVYDAGNNLTISINLPPGTYYTRVRAWVSGVEGAPSTEQVIIV
jgi:hypothetical protein